MSPSRVSVRTPGTPDVEYDVLVERGALARLGELCGASVRAHRVAVIADSRVAELFGGTALASLHEAGWRADLFTFPAGEWNKTREQWSGLTDRMLAAGVGRDAAVMALGGGVTGDLAGFVAATYMRGVPVVQVPTSLLAMLDSSVGGKTGVDTEAGKNLVGAFHQPSLVVVDPELLDTLPRLQLRAGLAEAVKTAAILDADLFAWMERGADRLVGPDPVALEELIVRVVRHKAEVVTSDPRERERRAILNFGHTVGHALELLGGYEILHGEAVAAGMRVEARLGERLGVTEEGTASRLSRLLEACGLDRPLESERTAARLWEAIRSDKKARAGVVRVVLPARIGEVARDPSGVWTFEVPEERGPEWLEPALGAGP